MAQSGKSDGLVGEVFYPSDSVIADARLKDWDTMADKARRDPQAFWAAEAEELEWFQKWDKVLDDFEEAVLQMVRGWKGQYRPQCNRPASENLSQEQTGAHLGVRRRQAASHLFLLRHEPRSQPHGEHHQSHGRAQRRPRHHLHGTHP